MLNEILLIRHASPEIVNVDTYINEPGPPLSLEGQGEAVALGSKLSIISEGVPILSSPFLRAFQTAEILSALTGGSVRIDFRLSELDSRVFNIGAIFERICPLFHELQAAERAVWVTHGSIIEASIVSLTPTARWQRTKFGNICPPTGVWRLHRQGDKWESGYLFAANQTSFDPFI